MKLKRALLGATLFAGALLIGASAPAAFAVDTLTNATLKEQVPVFQLDTTWPRLPNNWVLGLVASIRIDSHGNIWLIHRPRTVTSGTAAPSVIEFDPSGKYKASWGGPDWCKSTPGCDWPDTEHNILVDDKDNVYLSGSSPSGQSKTTRSDDMIIKFTNTGKFIKQFGGRDVSKGSTDHNSVNKPGDFTIWHGEMYISDGYGNRRVLVLDPDTFAFTREWAAFGKPPTDIPGESGGPGSSGGARPTAQQAGVEVLGAAGDAAGGGRRGGGGAGGGGGGRGARPALDTERVQARITSPVRCTASSSPMTASSMWWTVPIAASSSSNRTERYLNQVFLPRSRRAPPPELLSPAWRCRPTPTRNGCICRITAIRTSPLSIARRCRCMYQFGQRGAEPGNFQGVQSDHDQRPMATSMPRKWRRARAPSASFTRACQARLPANALQKPRNSWIRNAALPARAWRTLATA